MGKHSSTNSNLPPILGGAVALALLGGAVYAYASGNEPGTEFVRDHRNKRGLRVQQHHHFCVTHLHERYA